MFNPQDALKLQLQIAAEQSERDLHDSIMNDLYGEYDALVEAREALKKSSYDAEIVCEEYERLSRLIRVAQDRIVHMENEFDTEAA